MHVVTMASMTQSVIINQTCQCQCVSHTSCTNMHQHATIDTVDSPCVQMLQSVLTQHALTSSKKNNCKSKIPAQNQQGMSQVQLPSNHNISNKENQLGTWWNEPSIYQKKHSRPAIGAVGLEWRDTTQKLSGKRWPTTTISPRKEVNQNQENPATNWPRKSGISLMMSVNQFELDFLQMAMNLAARALPNVWFSAKQPPEKVWTYFSFFQEIDFY